MKWLFGNWIFCLPTSLAQTEGSPTKKPNICKQVVQRSHSVAFLLLLDSYLQFIFSCITEIFALQTLVEKTLGQAMFSRLD